MNLVKKYILSVLFFGIFHFILLLSTDDLYRYCTHFFIEDDCVNEKLNKSISNFGDSIFFTPITKIRPIQIKDFKNKYNFSPTEKDESICFFIDNYEILAKCYSDGKKIYLLLSHYRLPDREWTHFVDEDNWNEYMFLTEQIRTRVLGQFDCVRGEKWRAIFGIYGNFFMRNIFYYITILFIIFLFLLIIERRKSDREIKRVKGTGP